MFTYRANSDNPEDGYIIECNGKDLLMSIEECPEELVSEIVALLNAYSAL